MLGHGFWSGSVGGGAVISTDFVHGTHVKSLKYTGSKYNTGTTGILADAGSRFSLYIYFNTLPNIDSTILLIQANDFSTTIFKFKVTSAGKLKITDGSDNQLGISTLTMGSGTWYRISLAYTITSTSVNRFEAFIDANSAISLTNVTLLATGTDHFFIGIREGSAADIRISDFYVDNSNALTDTGNIWVTAKRPFSNGTTNDFSTQIGTGPASPYGTGHSPQVNERQVNDANGWSMIGAGSAITEEYSIENQSTGDIDMTGGTVKDYMGWVEASSLANETAKIVVGGVQTNIDITADATIFTKAAGSSTYPAGGTDIGIITATTVTTVSLYECGIMIAFIPFVFVPRVGSMLTMFQ